MDPSSEAEACDLIRSSDGADENFSFDEVSFSLDAEFDVILVLDLVLGVICCDEDRSRDMELLLFRRTLDGGFSMK